MRKKIERTLDKEKELRKEGSSIPLIPIIMDYEQVDWKKYFKKRQLIRLSYGFQNSAVLPKGVTFEVNSTLVDKLFFYKDMIKLKK